MPSFTLTLRLIWEFLFLYDARQDHDGVNGLCVGFWWKLTLTSKRERCHFVLKAANWVARSDLMCRIASVLTAVSIVCPVKQFNPCMCCLISKVFKEHCVWVNSADVLFWGSIVLLKISLTIITSHTNRIKFCFCFFKLKSETNVF